MGFDELTSPEARDVAIDEIRFLAANLHNGKMVLTARTGEFRHTIENSTSFEISPLNRIQILAFAEKWLGDSKNAANFVKQIEHAPFLDTAIRPL